MAFHYSPKIITDGLVFHVDAANTKSYSGSGTDWYDLSKNKNIGISQNSPQYINSCLGGLDLNGTNQFFNFLPNSNPITGNSAFSLCAWLNVDTHVPNNYGLAIFVGNAATNQSIYLGYVQTAQNGIGNSIGGGFYGINYGSGVLPNTGPHYIALTFFGGSNQESRLYVDGDLKVTRNVTPNLQNTSIIFGKANSGTAYWYNGIVYNTSIYNRALTQQEIQQNYNTTKSRFGL
jgi:hypothetical protein